MSAGEKAAAGQAPPLTDSEVRFGLFSHLVVQLKIPQLRITFLYVQVYLKVKSYIRQVSKTFLLNNWRWRRSHFHLHVSSV